MNWKRIALLLSLATWTGIAPDTVLAAEGPLVVVVMDPLSAPLSCDCVKGYAQRKYELLGAYLQEQLHRPVRVVWSESLTTALAKETHGQADLIIGKDSVVRYDAKAAQLNVHPVAALTDKDGSTLQTGLFVVRQADPAHSVADLKGYRIFFGPEDCAEKWDAPRAQLQSQGIDVAALNEKFPACSNAAAALMELGPDARAAAVISSYAEPLLAGCGTIKQGDLRVVGRSAPVPFITAFVNDKLDRSTQQAVEAALLKTAEQPDLLIGLETLGFIPFDAQSSTADMLNVKKKN